MNDIVTSCAKGVKRNERKDLEDFFLGKELWELLQSLS